MDRPDSSNSMFASRSRTCGTTKVRVSSAGACERKRIGSVKFAPAPVPVPLTATDADDVCPKGMGANGKRRWDSFYRFVPPPASPTFAPAGSEEGQRGSSGCDWRCYWDRYKPELQSWAARVGLPPLEAAEHHYNVVSGRTDPRLLYFFPRHHEVLAVAQAKRFRLAFCGSRFGPKSAISSSRGVQHPGRPLGMQPEQQAAPQCTQPASGMIDLSRPG